MIVPQIIRIRLLQPPISLSPVPRPILPLHQHRQPRARRATNPQHAQTHPISRAIPRRLTSQKHIRRDNPPEISKTHLHPRRNTPLIMPRHQIAHPHQHNRLRDVPARHDEEQREVLNAHRQVGLHEQHYVACRCDDETRDAEPVAVAQAVGAVGGGDGGCGRDEEDGDGADLRGGGGVAHFADYRGDEEGAGVAGVDDASVGVRW
jgi:hypothetical protein